MRKVIEHCIQRFQHGIRHIRKPGKNGFNAFFVDTPFAGRVMYLLSQGVGHGCSTTIKPGK